MTLRSDAEIAIQVLFENGGFTLTRSLSVVNLQAFISAIQGFEEQVELAAFTVEHILDFRKRNIRHLQDENVLLGAWLNEGIVYLDLSKAFQDREACVSFGLANGQQAVWDGVNGVAIELSEWKQSTDRQNLIPAMEAQYTHVIYSPELADDEAANEDDEESDLFWKGITRGDLNPELQSHPVRPPTLAPAFSSSPSGWSTSVPHVGVQTPNFDWTAEDDTPVYKWVWSPKLDAPLIWLPDENGGPHHQDELLRHGVRWVPSRDVFGFGITNNNTIEIESYTGHSWANSDGDFLSRAYADVKREFAKLFPNFQIVTPTEAIPSDPNDPYLRRDAAARWARENLAREWAGDDPDPASKWQQLRTRLGWKTIAADGPDKAGAMVALFPDQSTANKLALKDGEPAEELHITLAYFVDKADDRDDWDEMRKIAAEIAKKHGVLRGKIGGSGVFQNDDGDVLWASVNVPGLVEFHHDLCEALDEGGFEVSKEHGFTPHMTLKYNWKGKLPRHSDIEVEFPHVVTVVAEAHEEHDFQPSKQESFAA